MKTDFLFVHLFVCLFVCLFVFIHVNSINLCFNLNCLYCFVIIFVLIASNLHSSHFNHHYYYYCISIVMHGILSLAFCF